MTNPNQTIRGALIYGVLGILLFAGARADAADADSALWRSLATGETVALMRHASAPGYSDPPGFTLDDCSTQRKLSATGRQEAKAIGSRLRAHGITHAIVRSSQWCRCLDTARLLGIGEVIPTPALNSFFERRNQAQARSRAVHRLLAKPMAGRARVLVTHQVNITALTGVHAASGEIVVVRPENDHSLSLVGRIEPPALE